MRRAFTFALLPIMAISAGGMASAQSTLLNYEHRVVRAAEEIKRIRSDSDYSEEGVPYIKKLLPKTEIVDYGGQKRTVDNTWIWSILDSYIKENDPQARAAQLNEAEGRLRALEEHLQRAVSGPSESVDRDAEDARLREILSRGEYQQHEESIVGKYIKKGIAKLRELMAKVREALLNLLEYVFGAGTRGSVVPKVIVIGTIVAGLVLVAYMARRWKPPKKRKKKRMVLGEEVGADVTPDQLAEAAMSAARAGDFRSAIRKLYVSLLFELAEKQVIELEDSATNREYLKRVSGHPSLVPPMNFLTDRFDFVWYGMFPSSQEDFANCLSHYREAIRSAESLGQQHVPA